MRRLILLSVNDSWNVLNFRMGLVRRLQDRNFDVGVISPPDGNAQKLADLGIIHIPARIDGKGLSPIADLRLLIRYCQILHNRRPAAFLAWTVKPNVYGSMAALILGVPVINNVSGLGTAFIRQGLLTAIVSLLYRLAFSRSATVFFQNSDDRKLFVESNLVSNDRTALLPGSGIDTKRFAPRLSAQVDKCLNQPFSFLLMCRLVRDKGVVEYVQAARLVRAVRPEVRFNVLGFLDVANRTAIDRDELARWVDEGIIRYLGEADDVRPHIHAADCIVLPSYREGMPRSLLEGAALAKPLIATRVPGCTEIAREGENAFLCEARDHISLANAMLKMLDLPENDRLALGAKGRTIAVTEFDENIVVERYLVALRSALANSN